MLPNLVTKLQWVKKQIRIAGKGHKNFLGGLKEDFLLRIKEAGEDLTRTQFWKLFRDVEPNDEKLFCHYMILDTQLSYAADFSEVWETSSAPLLPELKGRFRYGSVKLPADFVKLGGEPDWVQNEHFPICERCDRDMGLVIQIRSLPHKLTNKHEALRSYTFGDDGTFYLFQCPHCYSFQTSEQCH